MRQQSALTQFSTGAQTTDERLLRAAANGTFLDEPPEPAPDAPGYRSGSTGKFVGYGVDEHQATRSTETGRITDIGEPEPVSRSTLTARYGPADGANSLRDDDVPSVERNTTAPEQETTALSQQDVTLSYEEAFEGVATGSMETTASSPTAASATGLESGLPPEDALAEQDELLSIERNERAAEAAGVLQPEPDGSAVGDFAAGANPFGGER